MLISFLVANFLNLLWHDPQGCIQSSRIEIVRQLPLLVLLVKVQQQSDFWSGLRGTKLPESITWRANAFPAFSYDILTTERDADSAARESGAREADRYFKSSWPEDDRPKEAVYIRNRACSKSGAPISATSVPTIYPPEDQEHKT
jgi:hypothetical protein